MTAGTGDFAPDVGIAGLKGEKPLGVVRGYVP